MSYLQRRGDGRAGANGSAVQIQTPEDLQRFPALLEFLFAEQWPDGTSRKPGTLLLFADEGHVKGCLSDRDQGLVAFLTFDCLSTLLATAEDALRSEGVDWRQQRRQLKR